MWQNFSKSVAKAVFRAAELARKNNGGEVSA